MHCPRENPDKVRGGGVGIIFKKCFSLIKSNFEKYSSFESVTANFRCINGEKVSCSTIYRPDVVTSSFFNDFDEFIGDIFLKYKHILICGDFNLHIDDNTHRNTRHFNEIISSYGLEQHVHESTHEDGHCLDLVISSSKLVVDKSIHVLGKIPLPNNHKCDHYPVKFQFSNKFSIEKSDLKSITFRNLKQVDKELFSSDLVKSLINISYNQDFKSALVSFNDNCASVLDNHAPALTKHIRERKCSPWFDGEYKLKRSQRRKAEKKKHESPKHLSEYLTISKECTKLAAEKKKSYFKKQFESHNKSSKSLFKFLDNFLDQDGPSPLPPSGSIAELCESFNNFFQEKIKAIRKTFGTTEDAEEYDTFHGKYLSEFRETNVAEISSIIQSSEFKTSAIDPLPSCLFKENIEKLYPTLCDLVNLSMNCASMDGVKLANIVPLIKGLGLDNSQFNNYRPISNLSFVGKLIEHVVLIRLTEHLVSNNLEVPLQSGYKKHHSTETLLLKVVNDILIASDKNKATIVLMLELSAAFDTVDHNKLLKILEQEIGVRGKALAWFKSFLTGRCQRVKIGDNESSTVGIEFGVPQGSVLGPVLFNIYIRSLYKTVEKMKLNILGFADDHQLYVSFSIEDQYTIFNHLVPKCFQEVMQWMKRHFLLINPGKTEVIVFGSAAVLHYLYIQGIFLDSDVCVRFSPVVKSLGFLLDDKLTFIPQINKLKSCMFQKLRSIARMKPFLPLKDMKTLVQFIVLSSIDYCNSLYFGCSKASINQLQAIQNRACRVIFGMKRRQSVCKKIEELHWLKVNERIKFKMLLLMFKCLRGEAPVYLKELFCHIKVEDMRSLSLPYPSESHATRPFQYAGIRLWNDLPSHIRHITDINIFKNKLKTHLFKLTINSEE